MDPSSTASPPSDPKGVTGQLCNWVDRLKLEDVPADILTRVKYLVLDGIACGIVGAHLPWSEVAAKSIFDMEGEGPCSIFGWEKSLGPLAAALLNSTFIQGFELDDYNSEAPLHSNSILIPALFAAVEHSAAQSSSSTLAANASSPAIDGESLLIALIAGYEIGPRIGLALNGVDILNLGWHSGTVFGPPACAAAVSKLLRLPPSRIEDAVGIACTQACGLMSAQFESMLKRMQHGFVARNGLFAALMAKGGYVGIQRVLERPYGGFLNAFSQGSTFNPQYREQEVVKGLGESWKIESIRVKPYAAMGFLHAGVDCITTLQKEHPQKMSDLQSIQHIKIELSESAFAHGGWKATERPLTATGAQMNMSYVVATQLVDGEVLMQQFATQKLDRDEVYELIAKTECVHNEAFDAAVEPLRVRITVSLKKGEEGGEVEQVVATKKNPTGVDPPLSNEQIVSKWRSLTRGVLGSERREEIERMVLGLEKVQDVDKLVKLLRETVGNPIA